MPNGPLTSEQALRIARGEANLKSRRDIRWNPIFGEVPPGVATVNCARCTWMAAFDAEHQGGYCLYMRRMMGTWHPVECEAFEPK